MLEIISGRSLKVGRLRKWYADWQRRLASLSWYKLSGTLCATGQNSFLSSLLPPCTEKQSDFENQSANACMRASVPSWTPMQRGALRLLYNIRYKANTSQLIYTVTCLRVCAECGCERFSSTTVAEVLRGAVAEVSCEERLIRAKKYFKLRNWCVNRCI